MTNIRLSKDLSARIIEELGGVNETARKLGTYSSCVSVWKKRGFPISYVYQLRCKFPNLASVQDIGIQVRDKRQVQHASDDSGRNRQNCQ